MQIMSLRKFSRGLMFEKYTQYLPIFKNIETIAFLEKYQDAMRNLKE